MACCAVRSEEPQNETASHLMRGLSGCNKRSFFVVESDGSIVQRARWLKAVSSTFLTNVTVYTVPEQSRIYRCHTQ